MWHRVKQFLRTPKGLLTIVLVVLAAIAAPAEGIRTVAPGFVIATIAAGLVDLLILRAGKKVWEFPSGAVLTAMIVAMVLRAQEPWYVTTITTLIAIFSKYLFRSRAANVFNPVALSIIISFYVSPAGQSWWGALTDDFPIVKVVLLAAVVF